MRVLTVKLRAISEDACVEFTAMGAKFSDSLLFVLLRGSVELADDGRVSTDEYRVLVQRQRRRLERRGKRGTAGAGGASAECRRWYRRAVEVDA